MSEGARYHPGTAMPAGTYIYCVMRAARKPSAARAPQGLPGAGHPQILPVADGLWLAASDVPLDRYDPAMIEASLGDLEWVSGIALAHAAVVEHFSRTRGATVVPMKLFTIFSSPARAIADVRGRRRALTRVFERIAGCEEWGVRVVPGAAKPNVRTAARPASGTAFLSERKRARDDARASVQAVASAADGVFSALGDIARDRRRRTDDGAGPATPLLDAAFLVPGRRRARFHAAARRAARDVAKSGGSLTLTGPWPAYNFVAEESR